MIDVERFEEEDDGDGDEMRDWQICMIRRSACREMLNVDLCEMRKSVSICLLNLHRCESLIRPEH